MLEARGFKLHPAEPRNGLDDSADRAALLLGEHFSDIEPFYRAIKRAVSGGKSHWFRTDELSKKQFDAIYSFGNRLHANNFLSHFIFHRNGPRHDHSHRPAIYFEPLNAQAIRSFFEGGWLERYVLQVLKQEIKTSTGAWCEEQFDRNVRFDLPGGGQGEFDVLVSLPSDKLLWLECKTGHLHAYTQRYNRINERYLNIPREQAALVLVNVPDDIDRAGVSDLSGMSVIHFSELRDWVKKAIG